MRKSTKRHARKHHRARAEHDGRGHDTARRDDIADTRRHARAPLPYRLFPVKSIASSMVRCFPSTLMRFTMTSMDIFLVFESYTPMEEP